MNERIAVSVRTAADLLDVSADTIRHAVNSGALPAKRLGRAIRIDTTALRDWFHGQEDARS